MNIQDIINIPFPELQKNIPVGAMVLDVVSGKKFYTHSKICDSISLQEIDDGLSYGSCNSKGELRYPGIPRYVVIAPPMSVES